MEAYKQRFATLMAEIGAIFFDDGLILKDGRPTPYFINMAMFKTGRLSREMGSLLAGMMVSKGLTEKTDIILGPSYKGSALALSTAIALWEDHEVDLIFDYDRKEAKHHGESSLSKSLFVNGTFFEGCRVFIVDDVATSMGTKYDLLKKIEAEARAREITVDVVGIGIGVDREQTSAVYDASGNVIEACKGTHAILEFEQKTGIEVYTVAGVREIIAYLYEEKVPVLFQGKRVPISEEAKADFDRYLEAYGVD